MRPATLALPLLLLAACGGDPEPASPDADAPLLEPPPLGEGRQLAMDVTIASGDETEQCQYLVVDDELEIVRFEHRYTTGSHHLLLYQTDLAAGDVDGEMFDCTGAQLTELGVSGIAYAAQVPDGELAYPADVGLRVEPGTVLLIQTHYLNASPASLDAEVRLNLWYASEPIAEEAGTLFFYDWAIVVPAGEPASARMRCVVPEDVDLIFGMSHMHRRGVGYQAFLETGEGEPTMLFETQRWEGVEPARYQPVQHIPAGSVIDFRCDYQGEAGRTIIEGPSAEANEMCMFVASYYPRLDRAVDLCATPGSGPVFDGDQDCGETLACVNDAADEIAAEQCLVDTCEGSSQEVSDLFTCIFFDCGEQCTGDGIGCNSCIIENCAGPMSTCQQAGC
jgi:hypothetical protein